MDNTNQVVTRNRSVINEARHVKPVEIQLEAGGDHRDSVVVAGAGAGVDEASTGSLSDGAFTTSSPDTASPDAASAGALTGSGGSAPAAGLGFGGP
ncbi:MAG: hypothetical protein P8L46_05440 [Acidimicrobiales bacterium]|nr:hypothetical protein [Acidimicrobiales bacterium]